MPTSTCRRRVVVAQLGARRHYAVPRLLHKAGILERFFTDSYSGDKPMLRHLVAGLDRLRPSDSARRWLSRHADDLSPEKVISFERLGLAYARARRRASGTEDMTEVFTSFGKTFNEAVLRYGLGDANVVFGFNRAQLELFEAAGREGRRCVLDQTMAPSAVHHTLLANEQERWSGWQDAPPTQTDRALAEREQREWAAADLILCPSEFVRESVRAADGPTEKCVLVPYGTDLARFPPPPTRQPPAGRPIRVLFAGEVGLRKGVPYLLEALRRLGPEKVDGRLVGSVRIEPRKLEAYAKVATFTGSVPRPEMRTHYAWADLFVFPSVCEGSAAVLAEALASGLPVICTPNSGPPPAQGVHVVLCGNVDALTDAILAVGERYEHSCPPPAHEGSAYGLVAYGRRLIHALTQEHDIVGEAATRL
jgi:hypothetical protein